METLIVSRTKFGQQRCIGGIILDQMKSVRLVQKDGSYWPDSSPLKVGGIWNLELQECASHEPPFFENVIALKGKQLREIDSIRNFLIANKEHQHLEPIFWEGSVKDLYEGKVNFQSSNSRAFISVGNEPTMSTGFWTPSKDLVLQADKKHYQYITLANYMGFEVQEIQEIAYVGEDAPLQTIPAGSLCRVSLAKPIKPHPDFEGPNRLYVQLSGWYL